MSWTGWPGLLGGALLLAGCMETPRTGVAESEVFRDGTDWAADGGAHPQVVRINNPQGRTCTGWLSSSNTITTNAHCLGSTTDFYGWKYDPTMVNSTPAQYAALQAMGPSIGGMIHPGGWACVNSGEDCCWGADMAILTFATPVPRNLIRPLPLIGDTGDEPECDDDDTCVTVIGTGFADGAVCNSDSGPASALDTSATQLFVESGLGDGRCPNNVDMLFGEYDFDDSSTCKGDSGSPILWAGKLMAQARGTGGDGGDDVVGPVLWTGGPNTARDFYIQFAADLDQDGDYAAVDNCDLVPNPAQWDWDGNDIGDACQDGDGDGLTDEVELGWGTNPNNPDTDNDSLRDGDERARGTDPNNPDTDGDGLLDGIEVWVYGTDPLDADTDNDELVDGREIQISLPTNPDTDGDGLLDGQEVLAHHTDPSDTDTDDDGLADGDEILVHATDPLRLDTDGDGLRDGAEKPLGVDPLDPDTDNDGTLDGDEDPDQDRLGDGFEALHGTDPRNPDSDGDTVFDSQDVSWIVTAVQALAPAAFAPGMNATKIAQRLDKAEGRTRVGDVAGARIVLVDLRSHLDGCGFLADGDDWLVDCTAQQEIRALIDVVLANL